MNRQGSVSLEAVRNDSGHSATLRYGRYDLRGIWLSGLRLADHYRDVTTGDSLELLQVDVTSSYLYRVLSTRSRILSVYAGGGMYMGYESCDPFALLPKDLDTGLGKGSFAYGIEASVQAELFITRRIALILGASVPIDILSNSGWLHHEYGAGIRINL